MRGFVVGARHQDASDNIVRSSNLLQWRRVATLLHRQHCIVINEPSSGRRNHGVADGTTRGHSAVADRRL